MLHVVSDVKGDVVQGSVIRIRLVSFQEHVMLSYEMTRDGMYSHAQDGTCNEVDDRLQAPKMVEGQVHRQLKESVLDFQLTHWLGVHHQRTQGVEQRLEEEPEELPGRGAEEPPLHLCGDVHVQLVATQVPVVVDVVLLEGRRVRHADGHVGPHGEPAVPLGQLVAKGHVVRDVVDGQRQRVVDAAAEGVRPEEDPLPGDVVHQVACHQLGHDHARHHPFQLGIGTHERLDLWIFGCGVKQAEGDGRCGNDRVAKVVVGGALT